MQQRFSFFNRLFMAALLHMNRRFDDVLHHRFMRPQVEALKHKAKLHPHQLDTTALLTTQFFVDVIQRDVYLADRDFARLRHFKKRDAA